MAKLTDETRGAALSQIPREAVVVSTSATRHYGVEANVLFDKNLHNGQRTFTTRDGHVRVLGVRGKFRCIPYDEARS